jgi:nucleotide-binding universal stress UspA family protein
MNQQRTRTVIAAHDGTPRGLPVIERARRIAEDGDARLVIVHVIDKQTPYWSTDPEHQHRLRQELAHIFEPAREIAGPSSETRAIGARSVVDGLRGIVEDENAHVVVVGSSHYGPLGHVVHGDVARALDRHCDCHVDVAAIAAQDERTV